MIRFLRRVHLGSHDPNPQINRVPESTNPKCVDFTGTANHSYKKSGTFVR